MVLLKTIQPQPDGHTPSENFLVIKVARHNLHQVASAVDSDRAKQFLVE